MLEDGNSPNDSAHGRASPLRAGNSWLRQEQPERRRLRQRATFLAWLCLWLAGEGAQPGVAQSQVYWKPVGLSGSRGRIVALAADPRSDSVLYLAASGGGAWKTKNGGGTWVPLFDSALSLQVCSLALDPRSPDVVYLGTGDDQSPRPAQGVARSADGGQSWTVLARFTNQPVCTLAVDPGDSGRVFAGSVEGLFLSSDAGASWNKVLVSQVTSVAFDGRGNVYAGMPGGDAARKDILARSSDGGRTWTRLILPPNPNMAPTNWISVVAGADTISVVISYQFAQSIPGGASSAQLPLSQLDFYRSTDSGNTWSTTFGIGQARPPVPLLADPASGSLYVPAATLLTSANQGSSWQTVPTITGEFHTAAFSGGMLLLGGEKGLESVARIQGAPAREISQLPLGQYLGVSFDSKNGIWGAGPSGLFGMFPATASRVEEDSSAVDLTGLWAVSSTSAESGGSAVYALASGARATFTFNGPGASWISMQTPWSGIAAVYVDGAPMGEIDTYSAQQVAQVRVYSVTGLSSGIHTLTIEATGTRNASSLAAWVWVDAFELFTGIETGVPGIGAVGKVAVAAGSSPNIFASGNGSIYRSTDGGASFAPRAVLAEGELRAPFPPLVLDPVIASSAYVAGRRLYRTSDGGTNWTALAVVDPDPTHVVIALAMAPTSRFTLFAATACLPEVASAPCTATSWIWRSTNGGQSWVQTGVVAGWLSRLAVDPRQSNTVYAAIGAFPAGPSVSAGLVPGGLLQSTNGGAVWASVRGNLPQVPVNTIVIDPTSLPAQFNQPAQRLYVGTDAGVFVSFNAGVQWTHLSHGTACSSMPGFCGDRDLPASPVADLVLRQPGNTLLAATFGRGIYLMSTVGFGPGVIVNPLKADATLVQGTTLTTDVRLTNASSTTAFDWQLSALDSWISVPEPGGTLRQGASVQAAVRISAAGLLPGVYLGRLQLVCDSRRQDILVEAHVTASPAEMTVAGGNDATGAVGAALPPLQVRIRDANQLPLAGISVSFAISSGGGSLSAQTAMTNAAGIAGTVLTLPPNPGTIRVVASSGKLSVTFTANAITAPALMADSVSDGVTFNGYTSLGPGSVLSISGQNVAPASAVADGPSLPTLLKTTRVLISSAGGDVSLPLFSVSPLRIKALLPVNVPPGTYRLRVEVASVRSNDVQISVAAFGPGIFTLNESGRGAGIFILKDGSLVTAANPADRGATVTFYAAGLGAVNPPIEAGQPGAVTEPLNRTVKNPSVFFDSSQAEVIYSGLAPGIAGRYQVTVRVPALVSQATNISVSLTIGGVASNRVTIPLR